jgi:hypothetical protein
VRRLRAEPELGRSLVSNARAFAKSNLREAQVDRLEQILTGLTRKR